MTRPQTLARPAPLGSLLKHPLPERKKPLKLGRNPRVMEPDHLAAVRQLPCLKCGVDDCEAAHVRRNSALHNKRTGISEKPDDKWTLPLCAGCHRLDKDSQHNVGEPKFYYDLGLNPLLVCEEIYAASPDTIAMRAVVMKFIAERAR
jgi:hypothetical protein